MIHNPLRILFFSLACAVAQAQAAPAAACENCDCNKAKAAPDQAVADVPIGQSPVRGGTNAPVTMVVFMDYECPFCVKVSRSITSLEERHGKNLRVVVKHLPLKFHDQARPAAEAAEAAHQQGKFWAFHDALLARKGALDADALEQAATRAQVDLGRWRAHRGDPQTAARVQQDEELARTLGATGTPTLFINGKRVMGARPLEELNALVEEAVKAAG